MREVQPTPHRLRLGAVLGLAIAVLSGCDGANLRDRVAVVEARLESTTEKPAKVAVLPPNATPIRYAVGPDEAQMNAVQTALLGSAALASPPFSIQHGKNGKISLSGIGPFGERGEKWLLAHGFSKKWELSIKASELTELERATAEAMSDAQRELNSSLSRANGNQAGFVNLINGKIIPGRVVASGNALDFAFSDDAAKPEFFVDLKLTQTSQGPFARGGRLIVQNGILRFPDNDHRLVEKDVPAGTTHLELKTDGMVVAFDALGHATELGRIQIVRIKKFKHISGTGLQIDETAPIEEWIQQNKKGPFLPGYVEYSGDSTIADLIDAVQWRNGLLALQSGIDSAAKLAEVAADSDSLPLIIHTPLPKTVEHLKALKIAVEKTNERTSIGTGADETDVTDALVMVLQGLRRRMTIHEENLRNAGKTRDAEGRLSAYRRKTIAIGPQGNIVEGVDKSELPKNYKPGDPDAGPDGFVVLSNVNKTVESAEFKATIEEYRLVRTALERLAPKHIFPDPPVIP